MTQDRAIRRKSAQTFRWVAVGGFALSSISFLILGQFLPASMFVAIGVSLLVEATRLDERSVATKRLSLGLAVVSAILSVIYIYTSLFS